MIEVPLEVFDQMVSRALDALPERYLQNLQNVAIVIEEEPTKEQKDRMGLGVGQTLFGLYEGAPLAHRNRTNNLLLPDKITIFKHPHEAVSRTLEEVEERVHRTVWHEVAHYYGLDHGRIRELE